MRHVDSPPHAITTARDAGENLHLRRPIKPFPQHAESMLQKTTRRFRNHLNLVLSPHAFSNTDFEKKVPYRTQLGVHLGAFDMHITSRTGGSAERHRLHLHFGSNNQRAEKEKNHG